MKQINTQDFLASLNQLIKDKAGFKITIQRNIPSLTNGNALNKGVTEEEKWSTQSLSYPLNYQMQTTVDKMTSETQVPAIKVKRFTRQLSKSLKEQRINERTPKSSGIKKKIKRQTRCRPTTRASSKCSMQTECPEGSTDQ